MLLLLSFDGDIQLHVKQCVSGFAQLCASAVGYTSLYLYPDRACLTARRGCLLPSPSRGPLLLRWGPSPFSSWLQLFDPLAPLDLDRMNSDFMHKHQAQLVGAHLHA